MGATSVSRTGQPGLSSKLDGIPIPRVVTAVRMREAERQGKILRIDTFGRLAQDSFRETGQTSP